jgi:hypothetical protein
MEARLLDLDGSVAAQRGLADRFPMTPLAGWGPRLRLACRHGRFRAFEAALADGLGGVCDDRPALSFVGSGDFHHVTLALLRRLPGPFNLLVLDNHPDWMRGVPFLHCGTWLRHALDLPNLRRVFHVGGDVDFDNAWRWLAPWRALRGGRVTVLPAVRRYCRGAWRGLPHLPLRPAPDEPLTPLRLAWLLRPYRDELADAPLYVSLDKDVLTAAEAAVNWDSGHLTFAEVETMLRGFVHAAGGQMAGMDVVGDWSPVRVAGWLRRLLHMTEHPALSLGADEATALNERTNAALLAALDRLGVLGRGRRAQRLRRAA